MKVAYFCLVPSWSYHFVQELDLIEEDLEAKAEVHVVRPGSLMRFSDTHVDEPYSGIQLGRDLRRFRDGMSLLSAAVRVHSIDDLAAGAEDLASVQSFPWPVFRTHEELNDFRYKGHDCGNAVLSSLIFHTLDVKVNLEEHREWVHRALEASVIVYLAAKTFNREIRPERVTVFNGRMATFRGVLRACQEDGVECLVHDRGATLDRVSLTKNTMPHDIDYWKQAVTDHWPQGDAEEAARVVGAAYFQKKRDQRVFNWTVFTEKQTKGLLPEGLESADKVYSLFTIGEYERTGLPQYFGYHVHANQLAGILDVIQILKESNFSGVLCIRIHPNSLEEKPSLLEALQRDVKESFVAIIPADSPVDTYSLIDASEKVLSFGSTVSSEATFWGKPSILLGTTEFEHLDSAYRPVDRNDLVRLLNEDLAPKKKDGCLKLGYYNSSFGRKLRYSQAFGLQDLTFKGKRIRKIRLHDMALRRGRKVWNGVRSYFLPA